MTELNAMIRDIPIPSRMKHLPISDRGFPVPWFVHIEDDGQPNFTAMRRNAVAYCYTYRRCWLCGEPTGKFLCFVVGPMCVVNRTTAEPPSHYECAAYAIKACPFLINPRAKRNEGALPEIHKNAPGIMLVRNPGVCAIYVTRFYKPINAGNGSVFRIGEPTRIEWYTRGRAATRAEVDAALESGLPILRDLCQQDRDPAGSRADLDRAVADAQSLLPA